MHEREHTREQRHGTEVPATTHAAEIPVLGILTRFVSNSEQVVAAVENAFGGWRSLEPSQIQRDIVRTVRLIVAPGAECDEPVHGGVAHVVNDDGRLTIHSRCSLGITDPQRGEAMAWVCPELLRDSLRFRYDVLEALTWALLTRCDRAPLHAAAIVRDGTGLLLCGSSGAGKSTLGYAAARAGMPLLSEDIVFVQTEPRIRVWGMPAAVHLLPATAARFDELSATTPAELHNGKLKVVVRTDTTGIAAAERVLDECGICILAEHRPAAEFRRLASGEVTELLDLSDPGFDVFATSIRPAVERIARRGAWLLHPCSRPAESVPLLAQMLDELTAARAALPHEHTPVTSFSQP